MHRLVPGVGFLRPAALVLALALVAAGQAVAKVTVAASVDRTQLSVGESTVLTVQVSGTQNAVAPELGEIPGFGIAYQGPSTQVSIVNGRMSSNISHRYQLIARQKGRHRLGPFEVNADGKTYETRAFVVIVREAGKAQEGAAGKAALQLEVRPERSEVYVGERIPLTIKLLVPGGTQVDDLRYPTIAAEGMVIEKLSEPAQRDEVAVGRRYRALYFETNMVPLRAGEVRLGATMSLSQVVPRQQRGRGQGLFGDFFGNAFAERRPVELTARAVAVTVRALPAEGQPADFSGAVGRFNFELTASPTEVQEGDPITLRMRIRGQGDLSKIDSPRIAAQDDLKVYEPLAAQGDKNARVFEQVVIPLRADRTELPPIRFSYFDNVDGSYRTVERGPTAIKVRPGAPGRASGVLSSGTVVAPKLEPKILGRDIVFIKEAPGRWSRRGVGFSESAWFWLVQGVPAALLAGFLLFTRRRDRFAANPRLRRFHAAGDDAARALAELDARRDGDRFFDALAGAVRDYLGAKLDLPPGAVESDRVRERLLRLGTAVSVCDDVDNFFGRLQEVRYASSAMSSAQQSEALALARRIVECLEKDRLLENLVTAALAVVLALATGLAGLTPATAQVASAQEGRTESFYGGNAAYAAGDYTAAAAAYEAELASGRESGALHFNLANAYFKNGDLPRAIAGYLRARRLLPRDPDVKANLAYAWELAEATPDDDAFWRQVLFFPAYRLTGGELGLLASVAWWMCLACLGVRLGMESQRDLLTRLAWISGVAAAFVFVSLTYRNLNLELRDTGVVTGENEATVRFEPSKTGTEHFAARPGAVVRISDERTDWLQVKRDDGRRGWVAAGRVIQLRDDR